MFDRFTDPARRVLVIAQDEARGLGHDFLGSEHILLALLEEGQGVAAKAMDQLGAEVAELRRRVSQAPRTGAVGEGSAHAPPFTPDARKSLEFSLREALALGHNYIGTEHLLLGLLREPGGVAARVLVDSGLQVEDIRATVLQFLSRPGAAPPSG
jgi:ATP-dependent Clp protease ATP-binding subunit ClpC